MLANFEKRKYRGKEQVWAGRYRHLQNLPHWHLECELIYVETGTITVSHNHQNYQLTEGDAIFLDSGEIHYVKSEEHSIVAILMFHPALIHDLLSQYKLSTAQLKHSYPILPFHHQIQTELAEQKPFYELQIRQSVIALMIQIFRGEICTPRQIDNEHSSIANYKHLLEEIDKKYSYITFSDAAAYMGFSEPYFSKFFRKISGMTFSQYLNTVRLEKAIDLLNHNQEHLSMTEIASQCGFDTIRHFNRIFKDITGTTPRELPPDYVLEIQPIRTIEAAFDPTLKSSELL